MRDLLLVQLGCLNDPLQGRVEPTPISISARLLKALLVAGFVVTLITVLLLWLPQSSRDYFFH